jgi:hypothetical protein
MGTIWDTGETIWETIWDTHHWQWTKTTIWHDLVTMGHDLGHPPICTDLGHPSLRGSHGDLGRPSAW